MKSEDWGFDTVDLWAMVLTDLQITRSEFETAKRKSYGLTWLPTAPADFLSLGRADPTLSYPDMRQAYLDAANQRTDCPIAYETARRVGFNQMREGYEYITYPLWQKHYAEVCKAHSQGAEFKKPQVLQIANETAPVACDSEVSDQYLANIKALLAGGKK